MSLNLVPSKNRYNKSDTKEKQNITDTSSKEKLSEVTEKQRNCKRKFQEERAVIIEKKVDKRKRLLCIEPKKKSNLNQSHENISKSNCCVHSKSSNLLNYFSKATSEELEKERLKEARITIKAEIHSSQDLQTPNLLDKNETKKSFKPKEGLSSNKFMEGYDEIRLLQSETLVFSPNDERTDSSVQQSKPKWSLKIQFQSNGVQGPSIDDEIYTPSALSTQLKENVNNYRDIPKILLPMKNRKTGWDRSSLLIHENMDKGNKSLQTNAKIVKTKIKENKTVPIEKSATNLNVKIKNSNDFCIESEIESSSCLIFHEKNVSKKTSSGKLAPVFLRKMKASKEIIAAKRLLLQSENNEHSDNNEPKNLELMEQHILPFPKISHINQINFNADKNKNVNRLDNTFNFSEKKLFQLSFNYSPIKTVSKLKKKTHNLISDEIYEFIEADTDFILAELTTYYSDLQSLWKTISKLSESNNVKLTNVKVKQKKISVHPNKFPQTNYLWIDKYKPNNSHEVIGNEAAVLKLKTWLQHWQSLKTNENYSSSEEFYVSDSSSSSDMNSNKVAVLIGPHGSGKTASVYAVAQELGYTVLEVNASSKRPGKKILKEFEEATKSHRVKNLDLENLFTVSSCQIEKNDKISKNSLIFMEDIDLVFEEDDGFVSAMFQLASNTKRPIVMTLRNVCLHLPKMAPQQLQINFKPIVGKKATVLLQLIALAETGYQLTQSCIDALCQDGDLRKSLLQLQYLLMSGRERILHSSLGVNDLSWKNMKTYIYKPAIKADEIRRKQQFQNDEIINNLVINLENFTLVSNLMNIKDPTCISINVKCEPSTSLIQSDLSYYSLDSLSLEIGDWIYNSVKNSVSRICKKKTNQPNDVNESLYALSKKQQVIHINSILSKIALPSLDHRSITVDYLPSIRNICRTEKVRNQCNSKRGNRFFHYLQNSRLSIGTMKTNNIFSTACKMLQEKIIYISKP